MTRFFICSLMACVAACAAVPRPHVEVVTTDHVDFAAGGVIHIDGSYGELSIEGWDEPGVEITVTRFAYPKLDTPAARDAASHELNDLHITATKKGDKELDIATPRSRRWSGIQMDYRIRVPRSSSVVIHHGKGDVLISDLSGDVDTSVKYGDILESLPRDGAYSFDASSKEGGIHSEFAGTYSHAHLFGSKFTQTGASSAHRNHLHVGIGGITIQQLTPPV